MMRGRWTRLGGWALPAVAFATAALVGCGTESSPTPAATLERPTQPPRSPGTERMARRLAALTEQAIPGKNIFLSEMRLERWLAQRPPENVVQRANFEGRIGLELLRAGRSSEAVARLADLLDLVDDPAHGMRKDFRRQVRSQLAIAHLRVAEQQNCLNDHGPEACLLPLAGGGVHRKRESTREALALYATLLTSDPEDLESRWLYNLTAMALGRYPDQVPENWLVPPRAFESDYDLERFPNIAHQAGLVTSGLAGGVVADDLDGDGALDLLISSWGHLDPLRFLHNRGDGTFEERTREAGLEGLVGGLNLVQADYDNDGRLDVLVLRGAWGGSEGRYPDSLLHNLGDGRFEDVTEEAGLLAFHPGQTAAWADVDLDGWLDLFIGHESTGPERHPCRLMRNLGDGTFEEITVAAGLGVVGFVKGVVWGDVDNDGYPDLFVSRLGEPNLLLRNRGDLTFEDITRTAGVAEPRFSFSTWFFDYDNDGWLDLFVAGYASSYLEASAVEVAAEYFGRPVTLTTARLYRNRGDGTFEDVTVATGVDRAALTMGCNFGDLDNDGYLDFYLGTGAPDFRALVPNLMFRNDAGHRFQDVTTAGGFGHLQKGHGIAFADFDGDGDQDVVAVLGGAFSGDGYPDALFENPGTGARWVTLRLVGTTANRAALGARVRVDLRTEDGPRSIHRVVSSGGSFGASSLQLEIGLGRALAIEAVVVAWPGGEEQRFTTVPMDRVVLVHQGEVEVRLWEAPR